MFDPQITPNDEFEKSLQENLYLIPVDVSSSALIPVKDIFGIPSVPSYVILDKGEKVATAAFTTSARQDVLKYLQISNKRYMKNYKGEL